MRDKSIKQLTKYISIESLGNGNEFVNYKIYAFWGVLKKLILLILALILYSQANLIKVHFENLSSRLVIKHIKLYNDAHNYSDLFNGLEGVFVYKAQITAYNNIKKSNSIDSASIRVENNTIHINILEKQIIVVLVMDDKALFVDMNGNIVKEVTNYDTSLKSIKISGSGIVELLPTFIPRLISLNFIDNIYSLRYLGAQRINITTNDNVLLKINLQTLERAITLFKNKKGLFLRFGVIDFRLFPARLYAK
ncbi:hypothetical protein Cyrtocomes_00160 [Candidatus Cyrtobacter comes]|uniref:POTRA domain-containing protein n=1 Tax=Candidatus Cyrtobacter comes TaxID=675776 RepID=A0ABU5L6P6_9RICK|nr:hypothetical protein [Candidatus Cyrtobacter comes]MDZ5761802.1 hypothetical protein [Candidatus Cyrtobacter comes]